jgi:hypothetical protein
MVARGFGRLLFGAQRRESNEFVVLMLRAHGSLGGSPSTRKDA